VLASAPQFDEVRFLGGLELGLLALALALGLGDLHALPGAHPDQVGFELGDHRENVEQQPPDWVVRVMHRAAVTELHVGLGEFAYDVAGVGDGAGEPVESGDHEGVAVTGGAASGRTGHVHIYDGGMDDLSIGSGGLAGKGVYATRRFAASEVVIAFELQPLTREQFQALTPGEELFVHSYGGQRWLYPPPARWVNHADQPSCYQDFDRCCDIALRQIEAGEPITIDATQETGRELLTFLEAYVKAQEHGDFEALRRLISSDAILWQRGRATRGAEQVASILAASPAQALHNVEWQVGTGRWEALCSAELLGKHTGGHASLFLRVLAGNWQLVYEHRS
jgi:hypothetical protein